MLLRPINLALADSHSLFRKMLRSFLLEQQNINVIIQATDLFELLSKLKGAPVDILLTDVFWPELSGLDAFRLIREEHPKLKILVLSVSTDLNFIGDLLDAGILGYISKTDEPEELLHAIKAASENRIFRNKLFTEALYQNKQNGMAYTSNSTAALSDREKKILQLIWEEKSNKEIADQLFLGVRSVEKIRQDLKEKIGAKSTIGLLKYAINQKIIGFRLPSSDFIR